MDDPLPLQFLTIAIMLVLSALFSATETAYTSLSLIQKKELETKKSKAAHKALEMANKPDLLLTTILVGNNIVNIAVSAIVTSLVMNTYGDEFVALGTGVLTVVLLLFGEITPKQIAMIYSRQIATVMSYPIWIVTIVMFPFVWFFRVICHFVTSLFKGKRDTLSVDSIMHIVGAAEDEGVVDEYESSLVQRVLHFSETTVKSIMTHRTEVFRVEETQSLKEAFPAIVASGYSRVPVYKESPENIVGVILIRDVLKALVEKTDSKKVSSFMHDPIFVPETYHVDDMFFRFQKNKLQMAVVLDEYGGLSGIVTMEDVAEQLFGELYDEHENGIIERIKEVKENKGSFLVQCDTPFQEFIDQMEFHYPQADRISTVAAYILEQNGDIPCEGDVVQTEVGNFEIKEMKGNRMESAIFTPDQSF